MKLPGYAPLSVPLNHAERTALEAVAARHGLDLPAAARDHILHMLTDDREVWRGRAARLHTEAAEGFSPVFVEAVEEVFR